MKIIIKTIFFFILTIPCYSQEIYLLDNFSGEIESKQDSLVLINDSELLTLNPTIPNDTFNGQVIDVKKWNKNTWNGATIEQDDKLIVQLTDEFSSSGCEIITNYEFIGDFDVQFHWQIVEGWTNPQGEHIDGAGMGVIIDGSRYLMIKQRYPEGHENILLYSFQDGVLGQIENYQTSGIFRITRNNEIFSFYFDTGNDWILLKEVSVSNSNAAIYLNAAAPFIKHKLKSYFDDFKINHGATTFHSEAGAIFKPFGFQNSVLLDSIKINAIIPNDTEIEINLYGKEIFQPQWLTIGKFTFNKKHKHLKIDTPSFIDSVKYGLNTTQGIILKSTNSDSIPILNKLIIKSTTIVDTPIVTVTEPTPNSSKKWDIYELTIQNFDDYENPFWDVLIKGIFVGPNGEKIIVEGFYYDLNTWKLRFSPIEVGDWNYELKFITSQGISAKSGNFTCLEPQVNNHGFINVNKNKPYKFVFSDSTTFIPVGINGHTPGVTAAFLGFDTDVLEMFKFISSSGLNTYRLMMFHDLPHPPDFDWNPGEGHANLLYDSGGLDRYNLKNARMIDRWLTETKLLNINWYLCLMAMGDVPAYPFSEHFWSVQQGGPFPDLNSVYSTNYPEGLELVRKYNRYVVNRFAAFRNVFMWEYNNEWGAYTSEDWLNEIDEVIHQSDPYNRPHTVSFWNIEYSRYSDLYDSPTIDVTDDHSYAEVYQYTNYNEFNVDSLIHKEVMYRYKKYQKPVMFGEFGGGEHNIQNYWHDYERLGYWAAFVSGANTLKWLSGYNSPEEIAYNKKSIEWLSSFSEITSNLKDYENMFSQDSLISLSDSSNIRAHCLSNSREYLVYLHHYTDHLSSISNCFITLNLPDSFYYNAQWFNPSTSENLLIETGLINNSYFTFQIPEFKIDLVLYLNITKEPTSVSQTNIVDKPDNFEIYQNYPNPFNNTTTISYSTTIRERIRIGIYNIMGQEVVRLVDEYKNAGHYKINWNCSNDKKNEISSGIFFIKLEAGNYHQVIKTVLIK